MSDPKEVAILAALIRGTVPTDGSLEDRILAAFRLARKENFFMVSDSSVQLAALECVAAAASEEERERIIDELRIHQALGAAASGIPVDMERLANTSEGVEPIGIVKLWGESEKKE